MELTFWAATDVGKKREHNEDNFLIDSKLSLFVVADGMGGHASGEVASHIAVHEMRNAIESKKELIEGFAAKDGKVLTQDLLAIMEQAVGNACAAIFQKGKAEADKRGMGTTISALLMAGERAFVAHVGDSRIYMVRQGQVIQLTEDHSLINELIRRGKVTKEGLGRSPYSAYKNAVTRAVGVYETVQVDTMDLEVLPGDQFLICSDGLHAYLDDRQIIDHLANPNVTNVPAKLVDLANERGGQDNITALVIRIAPQAADTGDIRTEELTRKVEVLKHMPLFRHLTYKEIIRILNLTEVSDYGAGEDVLHEGDPGDELYIILKGKIRLHKEGAFITNLLPGAHLGEMALIDRSPRSVSATADERSRLLILRRRDFYEIIRKDPPLSVKLLWSFVQVLGDRLRKTTADLSGARQEATAPDLTEDVFFDE
ncbi:MAG TPA: Stp1/IreP family PP2C-type Ser/Thr phosphatase [Polyangia bacterium]|nr:Stp1/IreP family PP2C-type Ser/Thr phosphatase [Polyangia bacterium]